MVSVGDTVKNCSEELMPVKRKNIVQSINGVADLPDVYFRFPQYYNGK